MKGKFILPILLFSFLIFSGYSTNEKEYKYVALCPGKPQLIVATWLDEDGNIITSTYVYTTVYAAALFYNPNDWCTYKGKVCFIFYRDIKYNFDEKLGMVCKDIEVYPKENASVIMEFTPTKEGIYHYDVFFSKYKYNPNEVLIRYSKLGEGKGGTSDRLIAISKFRAMKKNITKHPEMFVAVKDYWFEVDGNKVEKVVAGTKVKGCVKISPTTDVEGTFTLQIVRVVAPFKFDILGRDSVETYVNKYLELKKGEEAVICKEFVARQVDKTHNTYYYLRLLYEGSEVGYYPVDKKGLTVIPKTGGKNNPLIKSSDELYNIVACEDGWYTSDLSREVSGRINLPRGEYAVLVILQNTLNKTIIANVTIVVKKDVPLGYDEVYDRETIENVTLKPNTLKKVVAYFTINDNGKYHYEVYVNNVKILDKGKVIYVGEIGFLYSTYDKIRSFVESVLFNPMTLIGTIFILILIAVSPILVIVGMPFIMLVMRMIYYFLEQASNIFRRKK